MKSAPLPPFDPKLKAAAEEMKAILRRYDIAAQIVLCSETHGEFINFVAEPSWSALEPDPQGMRLKLRAASGGAEGRRKATATVRMAHLMRDLAATNCSIMDRIVKILHQHLDIEMDDHPTFTPHKEG